VERAENQIAQRFAQSSRLSENLVSIAFFTAKHAKITKKNPLSFAFLALLAVRMGVFHPEVLLSDKLLELVFSK